MNCVCNQEAKLVTVKKEGANKGRRFYACAKPQTEQCDFFCWEGETPRATKERVSDREALTGKVLANMNTKLDILVDLVKELLSTRPQ